MWTKFTAGNVLPIDPSALGFVSSSNYSQLSLNFMGSSQYLNTLSEIVLGILAKKELHIALSSQKVSGANQTLYFLRSARYLFGIFFKVCV
jgi:hypothetical protein